MDDVFYAFFAWCCQFVVVSTLFLATGYWLLGRSRRRKALRSQGLGGNVSLLRTQERGHVAHGA